MTIVSFVSGCMYGQKHNSRAGCCSLLGTVAIIEAFYFCACTQPTAVTEVGGDAPAKCNHVPAPPIWKTPDSRIKSFLHSEELVTGFLLPTFPTLCLALAWKWSSRLRKAASRSPLLLAGHQLPQGGKSKQRPQQGFMRLGEPDRLSQCGQPVVASPEPGDPACTACPESNTSWLSLVW